MRLSRRPGTRFALEAGAGCLMASLGLMLLIWMLLATQALVQAPVMPGPAPLLQLLVGLLPGVAALALPLGLLFGCTATAWRWADEGQLLALHSCGHGGRRLLPSLLFLGLSLAGMEALLTHWLEPLGRRAAAKALVVGTQQLALQPGQPTMLGSVLVHAEDVQGAQASGLFLAQDSHAIYAEHGDLSTPGQLTLEHGELLSVPEEMEEEFEWRLSFKQAQIPLASPVLRLDPPTLTNAELDTRIAQMQTEGQASWVEQTTRYKRSTLPMALPLLAMLGLSLGAQRVRPAVSATGVGLGWWAIMRICDHEVAQIGAWNSVLIPLGCLGIVSIWSWRSWSER